MSKPIPSCNRKSAKSDPQTASHPLVEKPSGSAVKVPTREDSAFVLASEGNKLASVSAGEEDKSGSVHEQHMDQPETTIVQVEKRQPLESKQHMDQPKTIVVQKQ